MSTTEREAALRPAEAARTPSEPGGERDEILELLRRHVGAGHARLARLMDLPMECRSAGCLVYDERGEALLDCGGYGVFLLGHCHPEVVRAVREQLERHPLATRVLVNPEQARAASALAALAPPGLPFVYFANSGSEAVETALKLARLNGKRRVISTWGGYHGKSFGALSVTGRPVYQDPFRPLLSGVTFVPFGDAGALEDELRRSGGEACFLVEPVQGEGGVRIPPPGYLRSARALTDRYGALLILDEIQTGLGRLGSWWGADREGVVPDLLLVGKGLSGGAVPVGAVVASEAAFAPLSADPFLHALTFGGNPLAMSAVQAALRVLASEDLVGRAARLGAYLLDELRQRLFGAAGAAGDAVVEVRGVGLLLGIEMRTPGLAAELMLGLLRRRVVVSHSFNAQEVVRLTPPALLSDEQCDWLLDAVGEAAAHLGRRRPA